MTSLILSLHHYDWWCNIDHQYILCKLGRLFEMPWLEYHINYCSGHFCCLWLCFWPYFFCPNWERKMCIQELSLIFPLLVFCFLQESFCICDGTIWSRSGWDIFPEEAAYLMAKSSPSYCLPYPLDKVCYDSAYMDAFQDVLCLMYISAQALFLILTVLSVYYLLVKWKKYKEKVS